MSDNDDKEKNDEKEALDASKIDDDLVMNFNFDSLPDVVQPTQAKQFLDTLVPKDLDSKFDGAIDQDLRGAKTNSDTNKLAEKQKKVISPDYINSNEVQIQTTTAVTKQPVLEQPKQKTFLSSFSAMKDTGKSFFKQKEEKKDENTNATKKPGKK